MSVKFGHHRFAQSGQRKASLEQRRRWIFLAGLACCLGATVGVGEEGPHRTAGRLSRNSVRVLAAEPIQLGKDSPRPEQPANVESIATAQSTPREESPRSTRAAAPVIDAPQAGRPRSMGSVGDRTVTPTETEVIQPVRSAGPTPERALLGVSPRGAARVSPAPVVMSPTLVKRATEFAWTLGHQERPLPAPSETASPAVNGPIATAELEAEPELTTATSATTETPSVPEIAEREFGPPEPLRREFSTQSAPLSSELGTPPQVSDNRHPMDPNAAEPARLGTPEPTALPAPSPASPPLVAETPAPPAIETPKELTSTTVTNEIPALLKTVKEPIPASSPDKTLEAAPKAELPQASVLVRRPESSPASNDSVDYVIPVDGTCRIRPRGAVRQLTLDNQDICEALRSAGGEVVVIGKSAGVATIRMSLLSNDVEQVIQVRVQDKSAAEGNGGESVTLLRGVLARKFPTSNVRLAMHSEALVVTGTAADRQQAVQIVAFIRETCLMPVVDRIDISRTEGQQR